MSGRQSGAIKLYQILTGNTHNGYGVDLHESELPGGGVPHPPHRHVHEELLFVREGEMEELDMVISHKVEIEGDSPGDVSLVDFSTIVQMIISAHCGDSCRQLR